MTNFLATPTALSSATTETSASFADAKTAFLGTRHVTSGAVRKPRVAVAAGNAIVTFDYSNEINGVQVGNKLQDAIIRAGCFDVLDFQQPVALNSVGVLRSKMPEIPPSQELSGRAD